MPPARPSRVAANTVGAGGLAILILAGRLAPAAQDAMFVAPPIWLFAWTAVRFALDLNGIP